MRLSRNLALVQAGVAGLNEFDLQSPIFAGPGSDDAEPLIRGVRVATHRQDMNVAMPHPRDLPIIDKKIFYSPKKIGSPAPIIRFF